MLRTKLIGTPVALTLGVLCAAAAPALEPLFDLALKDSDHKKLGGKIAEYFKAVDETKGINEAFGDVVDLIDKTQKKVKDQDLLALVDDWERAFYYARLEDYSDRVKKGKIEEIAVPVPGGESSCAVWVPSKYAAKRGPYPLVLVVPDRGQDAKAYLEQSWTEAAGRDTSIILAVGMPDGEDVVWEELGTGSEPGGAFSVMSAYGHAVKNYAVDMDRVFLAGDGEGGTAALGTAMAFPHLFAGVVSRGSIRAVGALNFLNVPTLFVAPGGEASAFQEALTALEYENHTSLAEGTEEDIWGWIAEQQREAYPETLAFSPTSPIAISSNWLRLEGVDVEEEPDVFATIDREENAILIEAENVRKITVFFNDAMVDMDAPVKVMLNGVLNEAVMKRNQRTMLDLAFGGGDWGRVFTATMEYDVPAPAKEGEGE